MDALNAAKSNGKLLNSIEASPLSKKSSLRLGYTFLWKFAQWLHVRDSNTISLTFANVLPSIIGLISALEIVVPIEKIKNKLNNIFLIFF